MVLNYTHKRTTKKPIFRVEHNLNNLSQRQGCACAEGSFSIKKIQWITSRIELLFSTYAREQPVYI